MLQRLLRRFRSRPAWSATTTIDLAPVQTFSCPHFSVSGPGLVGVTCATCKAVRKW